MKCPECGARFAVTETRTADGYKYYGRTLDLIRWARSVVGWWTPNDWVVRVRRCVGCQFKQRSIEILEDDIPHLVRTSARQRRRKS